MSYLGIYKWNGLRLTVHVLGDGRVQLCYLLICNVISVEAFDFSLAIGKIEREM